MNRNAIMAINDQEKKVWTIHLWRVALSTVDEIHHARMSTARALSVTQRTRRGFLANHEYAGEVLALFSLTSLCEMPRPSLESEGVEFDELSLGGSFTGEPPKVISGI
jgi:hypothetical protein